MAGAEEGGAPGGLCSINGRPGGRAAALGGGAQRALEEPAGAQAHGPRGGPAGAAQRGLGLLHGDIFSALRLNRGKAAEGRAGPAGLRATTERAAGGAPRGPALPAARAVGRRHAGTLRLLGAAPAPARPPPPLPRNGDESPAALPGPGWSRARAGRGARREL